MEKMDQNLGMMEYDYLGSRTNGVDHSCHVTRYGYHYI